MTRTDDPIGDAELERLGIQRVPTEVFLWSGYRYGNLRDAVAAATRGAAR